MQRSVYVRIIPFDALTSDPIPACLQNAVVYFADDDNAYDVRLFEEIRKVQNVGVLPVGRCVCLTSASPT